MSGFYPFDVKPETFYQKGDFEVVYGFGADNCGWRVGIRWLRSHGSGSSYPVTRGGEPCYFLISEELAAGLLETLPSLGEPKDGQRKEAIKKLKGENK